MSHEEPSTRERILRVASALFAQSGFHATTTRAIAEQVGIRQPGLFHHFSSKEEIMRELQRIDFEGSLRGVVAASRLDVSPPVALGVSLVLDGDRLIYSSYSFGATVQPAVFNDPVFSDGRALYEETVRLQSKIIGRGVASGDFVEVDPLVAAGALEWLLDGMLIDSARRAGTAAGPQQPSLIDTMVHFALRALMYDQTAVDTTAAEARRTAAELSS